MRVLVVEDDEMIGHGLAQALQAAGWSVDWVRDGVRPGAILSREQLETRIYGWGDEVSSNAVDVLIHGMRRKVGAATIRNVRGLGWRIATT